MYKIIIIVIMVLAIFIPGISAFNNDSEPLAVVLSGGGARGAYQIGVWKGLRDLGINIGAVYGVSVGAINGALMVMDELDSAIKLWKNLEKSSVMNISEASKRVLSGEFSLRALYNAAVRLYESGGINVSPLEELLHRNINETAVRKSGKDYGLVAYSLSDSTEKLLNLDDIPEGQLVDYILASANFPVFQRKFIDGEEFIDGGIYRNMAVDLIDTEKFSTAVLVSLDLNTPQDLFDYITGYSGYDLEIIYISPRFNPGSLLDFKPENATRLMCMGYLDCLKVYGELQGEYFYFYGEDPVKEMYLSLDAEKRQIAAEILEIENNPGLSYFSYEISWDRFIMPEILKSVDSAVQLLEKLARQQGVEELHLYSGVELLYEAVDKYISESHNSINYNRYLDFLSYLSLESVCSIPADKLKKNNIFFEAYLKSYTELKEQ